MYPFFAKTSFYNKQQIHTFKFYYFIIFIS